MKVKKGSMILVFALVIGFLTRWGINFASAEDKVYDIQWKDSYETHGEFTTIDGQIGGFSLYYLYDKKTGTSLILDSHDMPLLFWTYGSYEQGFDSSTRMMGQTSFATANSVYFMGNVKTADLTQQPLAVLKAAGISVPESAAKDGNYSSIKTGRIEKLEDEVRFHFYIGDKELQYCLFPNYGDHGWSRMYLKKGKENIEVVFGTDVIDKRSVVLYELNNGFTYIGRIGMMDLTSMVEDYVGNDKSFNNRTYFWFQLLNR